MDLLILRGERPSVDDAGGDQQPVKGVAVEHREFAEHENSVVLKNLVGQPGLVDQVWDARSRRGWQAEFTGVVFDLYLPD